MPYPIPQTQSRANTIAQQNNNEQRVETRIYALDSASDTGASNNYLAQIEHVLGQSVNARLTSQLAGALSIPREFRISTHVNFEEINTELETLITPRVDNDGFIELDENNRINWERRIISQTGLSRLEDAALNALQNDQLSSLERIIESQTSINLALHADQHEILSAIRPVEPPVVTLRPQPRLSRSFQNLLNRALSDPSPAVQRIPATDVLTEFGPRTERDGIEDLNWYPQFGEALQVEITREFDRFEAIDLSGRNLRNLNFGDATVRDTNFNGADLRNADLSDTVGLRPEQLAEAIINNNTLLPWPTSRIPASVQTQLTRSVSIADVQPTTSSTAFHEEAPRGTGRLFSRLPQVRILNIRQDTPPPADTNDTHTENSATPSTSTSTSTTRVSRLAHLGIDHIKPEDEEIFSLESFEDILQKASEERKNPEFILIRDSGYTGLYLLENWERAGSIDPILRRPVDYENKLIFRACCLREHFEIQGEQNQASNQN